MKNKVEMRGITLVALVITIIVLLILAGVSIAMLAGENGILGNSQKAIGRSENSQIEENATLADYENEIVGEYIRGGREGSAKRVVLFDGATHEKGYINQSGAMYNSGGSVTSTGMTGENIERVLSDNVNNYDIIHVCMGVSENLNIEYPANVIDKLSFDKSIYYHLGGFSSDAPLAAGWFKIDSVNSKIIYECRGRTNHIIKRVIGIKY